MSFPRGATPTFVLTIPEDYEDFTQVENITVDIMSEQQTITKSGEAVTVLSATEIEVTLTQEESLSLRGSSAELQVNWTYPDSALRWSTDIKPVGIDEQLHMAVISGVSSP